MKTKTITIDALRNPPKFAHEMGNMLSLLQKADVQRMTIDYRLRKRESEKRRLIIKMVSSTK